MEESLESNVIADGRMTKASTENTTTQKTNVYIWDMDETLILLKTLLNGTYAMSFNGSKDVEKGKEIGKSWENHILQACDDLFFYEQIENYNEPFLDALREYDDGKDLSDYDFSKDGFGPPFDASGKRKLAYRHRVIGQKYAQGLHSLLNQEMIKLWDDLYEMTDAYTDRWLSSARSFLELLSGANSLSTRPVSLESATNSADVTYNNIHVLVTSGSLIPSLVKCLLFRLDNLIAHENVYSSWEVGKLKCFSWIKARFSGPGVQFCAIGDGLDECAAAQVMKWPFIKIDLQPDGFHRFPGLSVKMVNHYIDVIYDVPIAENDNQQ